LEENAVGPNQPYTPIPLTNYEVGVQAEKSIVVPSFGTTSALFVRHFQVLRQLKRRVDLLKQSYFSQMDKDKCWEQIDVIIEVLDTGFRYLATEEIQETVFERFNGIKRLSLYDDVRLTEDE